MYTYTEEFGYQVFGDSVGGMWLSLVDAVSSHGTNSLDEGRVRTALQNVRVKSKIQNLDDDLIGKYGKKENVDSIVKLTFRERKMVDIDIKPSFSPGAKSYYQRIVEGRMLEFVIKRLSMIPESKKAVIVFPTYEDYEAVLATPKDDYLPCIVSVQFRLLPIDGDGYQLQTTFYARSMDIYQKGYGNFVAMTLLSSYVAKEISHNLHKEITLGPLDGLIEDVHIYGELTDEAKEMIQTAQKNNDYVRA